MTTPKFYRVKQLIPAVLPLGKTKFYNLVRTGVFPQPHRLGKRVSMWSAEQVDQMRAIIEGQGF